MPLAFSIVLLLAIYLFLTLLLNINQIEENNPTENKYMTIHKVEFDINDLQICIKSLEYFIQEVKQAEKIMPKEFKKRSKVVLNKANQTLKKLKTMEKEI